jgi:acyl-CoA thioesterase II
VDSANGLLEQLDLIKRSHQSWLGATPDGSGSRPNLFGGLVAAQALRAGHMSAGLDRQPHSVHAYFLSSGHFDEPLRFDVLAVRDGRSFSVRHIEVSQSGVPILTMIASFQIPESGDDYQVDGPGSLEPPKGAPCQSTGGETGTPGDGPFEMVETDPGPSRRGSLDWSAMRYWARVRDPLPDDPGIHACALLAMGDLRTGSPPRVAMASQSAIRMTSLDYSMWFRSVAVADRWMRFDLRPGGNGGGRGLTHGLVHAEHGQVASFAMEMLLRLVGQPGAQSPAHHG